MDPPTHLFDSSPPRVNTFTPPSSSLVLPPIHSQQTPGYALIHHLLQPAPKQTDKKLCCQRQQDSIFNEKTEKEIKGGAEGVIADERIQKRQWSSLEWNQDLVGVKRMKLESPEVEKICQRKRKEREELKEQLEDVRERLKALQKRVWQAFGKKHWSKGEREWKSRDEVTEEKDINSQDDTKRHKGRLKPQDVQVEAVEGALLLNYTGLFSNNWDGELGRDREEGGLKFARALKLELGSTVARVIDRVLRLYTETTEAAPLSPAAVVSCAGGVIRKGGWGGLRRGTDLEEKGIAKHNNKAPPGYLSDPATPLGALRLADVSRALPGPSQPLPLPEPSLLSPGSQLNDDPSSSIFHSAPSVPASFPPPPPAPPLPPLPPLLHYTMHQHFTQSLPHLAPLPLKGFHLNTEGFTDLGRPSFPPPLPLLRHLDPILSRVNRDRESGRGLDVGMRRGGGLDTLDLYLTAAGSQEGLSPCHLKKAKLMFFYTRYPSSNTLKTYFPDVKFNRCVTSQMIKWFSNFREFFYIQMERFARQAVREALTRDGGGNGCRDRQLRVGHDTELFRILNMHYNKSNVYQVPQRFIEVSEVALREFYAAIWTGRDSDPCWKKGIYKIICKLDSPVPDAFRMPGCPVG